MTTIIRPAAFSPLPFTPRMAPLEHQARFLDEGARRADYALFWEQGTGKTKGLIDNAALLAVVDNLQGGFVLAPNGVHRNWHTTEIPKHWPEDAPRAVSFAWDTTKAGTKAHREAFAGFLASSAPFKFFCMSYDGMLTEAGRQASWAFIRSHRAMYIADESQRFKTPGTERTKIVIKSSVYTPYRRIASGTPMDTPFDIYTQVRFLDPQFWHRELGIGTFAAFKAHFATWRQQTTAGGRSFPVVTGYRNLDQMAEALRGMSSRVLKSDVLDLPPKVYKRVVHPLTNSQRAAYEELRSEALTILESGSLVTAEMALVLQLRLTQIGCGFINPAAGEDGVPFTPNPRGEYLREILTDLTRPSIIWCAFVHDQRVCEAASRAAGRRPVVFNGQRPDDALDAFHAGEADDIIAGLQSNMREGYTLNEADTTIYYSNLPRLLNRLQSEDRNHRIGQGSSVQYIDMLAERTIDARTLDRLVSKRDNAGLVLGDDPEEVRAWLREALVGDD